MFKGADDLRPSDCLRSSPDTGHRGNGESGSLPGVVDTRLDTKDLDAPWRRGGRQLCRSDADVIALRATIGKLNQPIAVLTTLVRLLVVLVRISGLSLEKTRVESERSKNRGLRAVASAESVIGRRRAQGCRPQRGALRVWKRRC